MASTTLQVSKSQAYCTSSWTGTEYSPDVPVRYTSPTTGSDTITVTVPATLTGVTFTSATVSYTTILTKAGSRSIKFSDTNANVTNASMLQRLQNGDTSIQIVFRYCATGGTGGVGTFSGAASWNNFSVTITYTAVNGITGTATITSCGTVTYSVDTPSLAAGETAVLGIYAQPTRAITGVSVSIRPSTLTAGQMTFSATRNIAANSTGSFSFSLSLSSEVLAVMTNRLYEVQMQISFITTGSTYSSSWFSMVNTDTNSVFHFVKNRIAPMISGVTWTEYGTAHITKYGNIVQGKTIPVLTFATALDSTADSSISIGGREISIDGKTYSPGENSCTVSEISSSGSVPFSITVTDSYGLSATYSGTVTVLAYTPPSLTDLSIDRYTSSLDSGGHTIYELDDDGDRLWFDGNITVQTSLGSGTNSWTLVITPSGRNAISAVSNSSTASVTYTHNRAFLSDSYDNTMSFDFTVTLTDQFTTKTYDVSVPKAGGYFNIEKTGVSVGKRSEGTEADPLFEVQYPSVFYGDVDFRGGIANIDSGWQDVNFLNGTSNYDTENKVQVRKYMGIIFLKGSFKLSSTLSNGSNRNIIQLPEGFRPGYESLFHAGKLNDMIIDITTNGVVNLTNRSGTTVDANLARLINAVYLP